MRAWIATIGSLVVPPWTWHATELGHGTQTAWNTAQAIVIRDTAAFRDAWTRLYPNTSRRPARPAIDFSKYRVFIVTAGAKPTGGFRMALSNAVVARDSALVTVTLFTPPTGCGVTQELTTPAVAIAVPAAPVPFRIIAHERADTVRCN